MKRRTFLQLAALLSLSGVGCGREDGSAVSEAAAPVPMKAQKPQKPPVIMIVLDTVRASNCGAWGYRARATTPHLDGFVKEATQYSRAIAPAPWTLPSHASLFTGRFPFEHGTRTRLLLKEDGALTVYEPPLDDSAFTLAEGLAALGYNTGAFVANTVFLSERYNVMQGFGTSRVERIPGMALADEGLAWMAEHRDAPFFAFFNMMDAHRPYNLTHSEAGPDWEVPEDLGLLDELYWAAMPATEKPPAALVDAVTRQYDAGILNADRALGRILAWLKSEKLFDDAVVVVLSDHGEFLGEQNLVEHSKDVYQGTAWVPMAIKYPGQSQAEVVTDWTSLCTIPGRVLDHIGDVDLATARDMVVGAQPQRPVLCENYYSRAWDFEHEVWGHRFRRHRTAYYSGKHKLIYSSDDQHELFDLEADKYELRNLAPSEPALLAQLSAELRRFKPVDQIDDVIKPQLDASPLTPEEIEEMEALGYLGVGNPGE